MAPKPTTAAPREVGPNDGPLDLSKIKAGPLDSSEVTDTRDTSPRSPEPVQGKYLKAFPARGATALLIPASDFLTYGGIEHPDVYFDYFVNGFKVLVGSSDLTKEGAEFLSKRYPDTFKYVTGV